MQRIYVITDLGPGDGGKGNIVHSLARKIDADVIIKRGGAQGSHGVQTSYGEKFNFSQWGCGTFEGIPTFLSRQMVISPVGLWNEAGALERNGIYNPFMLLSCDRSCIAATPFHRIASQIEELLRRDNPRGTVGTGVGQASRMYYDTGKCMTVRAYELTRREAVRLKLQRQRDHYKELYARISRNDVLPGDAETLTRALILLDDDDFMNYCVDLFEKVGKKLHFDGLDDVLRRNRSAIVECSHGVLTDAVSGLRPHVSAIRTLPEITEHMLRSAGYRGQIIHYAVHRAYEIRHGAGPMPTYDPEFTAQMLPNSHKDENRWQGKVRAGALDLNLMRYALNACKETKFDGLCLTWFDQILAHGRNWQLCDSYLYEAGKTESYINYLKRAIPIVSEYHIDEPISTRDLFSFVGEVIQNSLGIPLKILSVGPTELDQIYYFD